MNIVLRFPSERARANRAAEAFAVHTKRRRAGRNRLQDPRVLLHVENMQLPKIRSQTRELVCPLSNQECGNSSGSNLQNRFLHCNSGTSEQFSALSGPTPAPVVAERRARPQPTEELHLWSLHGLVHSLRRSNGTEHAVYRIQQNQQARTTAVVMASAATSTRMWTESSSGSEHHHHVAQHVSAVEQRVPNDLRIRGPPSPAKRVEIHHIRRLNRGRESTIEPGIRRKDGNFHLLYSSGDAPEDQESNLHVRNT